MFNISELDQMVISQLSLHDLTQCARVNKQWHHAVIIHLWSDLSFLQLRWESLSFFQFVLDDYRRAHQHQQEAGEKSLTAPAILNDPQHRVFSGASFLSEYGPCIQKIPEVTILWKIFVATFYGKPPPGEPQAQQVAVQPSGSELLHYFLIHCTALKKLSWVDYDLRYPAIWKTVACTAIQHVQELDIKVIRMAASICQYILSQCSNKLETLTLDIQVAFDQEITETEDDRAEPLLGLKELRLNIPGEKLIRALSSFWRRCEHVERLVLSARVSRVFTSARQIAAIIETHMPNVTEIRFPLNGSKPLNDRDLACILSSCRAGLKVLEITNEVKFGELSCTALLKHSATLEKFTLNRWLSRDSELLRRILSSCPKLHTFVTLGNEETSLSSIPFITANDFIDFDQESNTLKPWPCESALKILKIKITRFSYQGWSAQNGSKEGLIQQHQTCERLSRFVNLEELWLGHSAYKAGEFKYEWDPETREYDAEVWIENKGDHQHSCPQMSLDSGLGQLETLKELRRLNVSLMETKIGQNEAEWMKEYWPKLRELDGLQGERNGHAMAVAWFRKNAPLIRVPLKPRSNRFIQPWFAGSFTSTFCGTSFSSNYGI